MYHDMCVEVKGQLIGIGSLLPPYGSIPRTEFRSSSLLGSDCTAESSHQDLTKPGVSFLFFLLIKIYLFFLCV